MTDEAGQYAHLNKHFTEHDFVTHGTGEYVRGDVHTNTVEGFYSVFKRGMKGIYQHCPRSIFIAMLRNSTSGTTTACGLVWMMQGRTERALTGIVGKRLIYRPVVKHDRPVSGTHDLRTLIDGALRVDKSVARLRSLVSRSPRKVSSVVKAGRNRWRITWDQT